MGKCVQKKQQFQQGPRGLGSGVDDKNAVPHRGASLVDLVEHPERVRDLAANEVPSLLLELTSLQSALTARLLHDQTTNGVSNSPDGTEYLSTKELAQRLPYADKTLRNLKSKGEFVEGRHYFKRRGRVVWSWSAMQEWTREDPASVRIGVPLVRNRRYAS